MFQNLFLSSDVCSVASYSKYILAGIGDNLYIYEDEKLKLKTKIFNGERIHDIQLCERIIIIKGCRKLSLLILENGCEGVQILSNLHCKDWIQDVFYDSKAKVIVLATAHNVIEMWDIQSKKLLDSYVSEEKCILYSCKFVGSTVEDFVLLCGTVFSEIVIWAPFLPANEDQLVLHRLKGHDGVIFSIAFSQKERIICSTSDDRSLRIWRVNAPKSTLHRDTWKEAKVSLIYTLYGHTARVWKSLILSEWIISAGEDSKICVWNKNGRLENCVVLHQESGIRGLCRVGATDCIVTGGEDGAITLITPQKLQSHAMLSTRSWDYNLDQNFFGLPRKVAFLKEKVICITDRGCVLFAENQSFNNLIYNDKEFSNYCLLEVSKCGRFLLLGSITGRIVIIASETNSVHLNEKVIEGKIFSVHWLPNYIVICASNGALLICKIDYNPILNLDKIHIFRLPDAKERWTTCALIHQNYLFVGDRMGSIHVYFLHFMDEHPQESFKKVHGHLGVTDIIQDGDVILTSGRDGKVNQFSITKTRIINSFKYKLQLEWPWRMVKCSDDILVLGFSSIYFVIWSLRKREILAKYNCGGGHRSCDFIINNDICKLLYIKDKRIHFSELSLFRFRHIQTGFHGKEINCLKILQEEPLIFVSGSEDTTLRITRLNENSLDQLYIIENHISSVRDLNILVVSKHERLLFSSGGRGQISIHKYNVEDRKYEEIEIYFLHKSNGKLMVPEVEGETRIMCICSVRHRDEILVSAACSDRQIRIFNYENFLNLLFSIPYGHCILKVHFIQLNSCIILLSMGTDGCIVFWEITDGNKKSFNKIDSIRIHQSGINSFVMRDLKNGVFLLATGGDDNLLSMLLFSLDIERGVKVIHNWRSTNAHSGQITGIKLLGNVLLTTSVDQRLNVWQCTTEGSTFQMKLLNQYISPVADIQGVEAFQKSVSSVIACLHGKGVDIIEIDVNSVQQSMSNIVLEQVTGQLECGEGPHWDSSRKCLYLVDINRSLVLRYVPATKEVFQAKVDGPSVSLIIPVKDTKDKFLIGIGRSLAIMTWDGIKDTITQKELEIVCTVEGDKPNNRFNDGKADAKGRILAGTMGAFVNGAWEMKRGSLYSVGKDRIQKVITRDIGIANGLAWSLDNKTFYYIDSLAYRIDAFDYNLETGDATNRRVLFDLKSNGIDGLPDGMCIDTNGNLWVALYEGGLMCINPTTKQVLRKFPLPGCHITSVTFGGENLDELYVTSAAQHMTAEERKTNPLFGCTFKITGLGVKGFDGIPVIF